MLITPSSAPSEGKKEEKKKGQAAGKIEAETVGRKKETGGKKCWGGKIKVNH